MLVRRQRRWPDIYPTMVWWIVIVLHQLRHLGMLLARIASSVFALRQAYKYSGKCQYFVQHNHGDIITPISLNLSVTLSYITIRQFVSQFSTYSGWILFEVSDIC